MKNKTIWQSLIVIAILIGLIIIYGPDPASQPFFTPDSRTSEVRESGVGVGKNSETKQGWSLKLNDAVFKTEIADTEAARQRGLSGRKIIGDDEGMFFVFDSSGYWGIWMKDMLFPIDIIWLDENLTAVDIKKEVSPETYPTVFTPIQPTLYVLEIAAGQTAIHGINIGDQAILSR